MIEEQYDFGTLKIGECFIIGEINEGVDVGLSTVFRIIEIANKKFKGKPWGYISNRIHSYSLSPMVYIKALEIEKGIKAFAIVANTRVQEYSAKLEKQIAEPGMNVQIFSDLDMAVSWVREELC